MGPDWRKRIKVDLNKEENFQSSSILHSLQETFVTISTTDATVVLRFRKTYIPIGWFVSVCTNSHPIFQTGLLWWPSLYFPHLCPRFDGAEPLRVWEESKCWARKLRRIRQLALCRFARSEVVSYFFKLQGYACMVRNVYCALSYFVVKPAFFRSWERRHSLTNRYCFWHKPLVLGIYPPAFLSVEVKPLAVQ